MRRVIHLLLASLLVALSVASFSASAAPRCGVKEGRWRILRAPSMKGGSVTTGFAIDPIAPNRMFATNGTEVMRSENGGCDWRKALNVTELPAFQSPLSGNVKVKEFGLAERGARRTFLLVEEQTAAVARPHVVISNDGGGSWQVSDTGLPPAGTPVLLRVAPSSPDVAYLVVDVAGAAVALFATTNGGTTWEFRNRVDTPRVNDLRIDPLKPDDLWLAANNGLYHSTDGGINFESIDEFAEGPGINVQLLDVYSAGGPARVMAFISGAARLSANGGRTWTDVGVPAAAKSAAHGQSSTEIVMSTATKVYAFAPTILNWVDMFAPLSGVKGLQSDRAGRTEFYGFTDHSILIFEFNIGRIEIPKNIIEIPDVSLIDSAPPDLAQASSLTPGHSSVRIPAGKDKKVTYDLKVPRTLTPLDVMFVVDTSSSMTQVIHEAADALEDIHNGLVASGAAVEFGLVEYRSYPTDIPPREPPGDTTDNYVYQRVLDVGASAPEMEQGIEQLVAAGGGIYDAQLEALWQLATGSGKDVWPPGPSVRDVPRGLQANFRAKALKVVLHVGDEPFGKEENNEDADNNPTRPEGRVARPDIPEFEQVAAALRENNIKHLGLSLYPDATPDLRKMARATGSFAPTGGVDCDRNGSIEVPEGAPLVCVLRQDEITDANLTPAIVELVEAVRTKSNVGLKTSGEGASLVKSVSPDSYSSVLLQADNSLEFDVTYHCPRSRAGDKAKLELMVNGLFGTPPVAETTVICGEIEKDEPFLSRPFQQVLAFIPLLPLAPPPPPVNVSSATQAQAQAQANAAFAAQEQEQPQVAMVHQLHAEAKEALAREEYSFTALKQEEVSPVPLYAAAALLSMAFGTAMVVRNRIRIRLRYLQ